MQRKLYPIDLTDKQWAVLAPLIPIAKTGGRPRQVNLREVLNEIFWYYQLNGANSKLGRMIPGS
jgi:putative transposase